MGNVERAWTGPANPRAEIRLCYGSRPMGTDSPSIGRACPFATAALHAAAVALVAFALGQAVGSGTAIAFSCRAGEIWGLGAPTVTTDDPQGDAALETQLWEIDIAELYVEEELFLALPGGGPGMFRVYETMMLEPAP